MEGFERALPLIAKEIREQADERLRTLALRGLRGVVLRSPVGNPQLWKDPEGAPPGYVGGRFRANWQVGIKLRDTTTTESTSNKAVSSGKPEIDRARVGDDIFISNSLPYAIRLETGWSQQAPLGMVTLTLIELQAI